MIDAQHQHEAAIGFLVQLLRRVPDSLPDITRRQRAEAQPHLLRRAAAAHLAKAGVEKVLDAKVRRTLKALSRLAQLANAAGSEQARVLAQVTIRHQEPVAIDR